MKKYFPFLFLVGFVLSVAPAFAATITPSTISQAQVLAAPFDATTTCYQDVVINSTDTLQDSDNFYYPSGSYYTGGCGSPADETYAFTSFSWSWLGNNISQPPTGNYNVIIFASSLLTTDACSMDLQIQGNPSFSQTQSDCAGLESTYHIEYLSYTVMPDDPCANSSGTVLEVVCPTTQALISSTQQIVPQSAYPVIGTTFVVGGVSAIIGVAGYVWWIF